MWRSLVFHAFGHHRWGYRVSTHLGLVLGSLQHALIRHIVAEGPVRASTYSVVPSGVRILAWGCVVSWVVGGREGWWVGVILAVSLAFGREWLD